MKKIYILLLAVPILFFALLYLSIWWFIGCVAAVMVFIAYRFYAASLQASEARKEVLEKELEGLHVQLENAVLKEQKTGKEAEQVKQTKQQLLSVISHEIRTPMNGVLGMSLLFEDTPLTIEQQEYITTIRSCAESLLTTINNLLVNDIIDFSKLQREGNQLEYKNFDLRDSIEEVVELFGNKAGAAGLDLIYEIDKDVPEQIIGDSKRLRQVLMNLIENAIKFTRKGEIFLSIHRTLSTTPGYPPELNFAVRDTGIGIASDQLKYLFKGLPGKEFKKANVNEAPGLGLIVCKKIVELMGGNINAKSEQGIGSTFTFAMPVIPSLKSTRDHAQQNNMINLEGKRILIVDDNATSLSVLVKQVTSWKMFPVAADSGKQALEILSNDNFDIVLTDISMPEMDGVQLTKTIKDKHPAIPVIGMNYRGDEKYEKEVGIFAAVITKPVRLHLLRDRLLAALSPATVNKLTTLNQMSEDFSAQYPLRILIAEDNLVNQKIAFKILNKLGYQPAVANHGKEALEMVSNEPYDIILMDVQMPQMNGLEATRMIRTCLEIQPIIIAMTANVMQGDRDECLQAGMDDYMSKPIDLPEVAKSIREMVIGAERKAKDLSIKNKVPLLKTNKYLLAILCSLTMHHMTAAQWKAGIEQYFYTHTPLSEALVPICHIQSPDNFYAELRYNYEEANTLSLYIGKTFSGGNNLAYTITPMAGYSTGRFTGLSLAINADAEWKKFFLSSQTQYSLSVKKNDSLMVKKNSDNFFFSWSELGYNFSDHFYAGLTMQYTRQTGENDFEPGFLTGLSFKNLSFPFYVFSPFHPGRYFVLGVNYEFSLKRKNSLIGITSLHLE